MIFALQLDNEGDHCLLCLLTSSCEVHLLDVTQVVTQMVQGNPLLLETENYQLNHSLRFLNDSK